MDIYYKRVITWKHWPENDQKEYDMINYSRSKNRFEDNVFLELDPSVQPSSRKKQVGAALNVSPSKINLLKI